MTDFILIEGRGRANAVLALAATKLAGHDASLVRTVNTGYEVPAEAREFYDRLVEGEQFEGLETVLPIPAPAEPAGDGEPAEEAPEHEPEDKILAVPAKNASKATWEDFAVDHGYDKSEGLTRDQIIERYGSSE